MSIKNTIKNIKKLLIISITLLVIPFGSSQSFAANTYQPPVIPHINTLPGHSNVDEEGNPILRDTFASQVIPRLAVILTGIGGAIALLMVVISGVRFAINFGNDEQVGKAKDQLIFAIGGLLIAMLAYTIVRIVVNLNFNENNTQSAIQNQTQQSN